jgi:hypothetical protein
MTLLDAPVFDEAGAIRRRKIFQATAALIFVLFIGWWLVAGRPVDWPWNWNTHMRGRMTINAFLEAVEKNDMPKAYGIWMHDPDWQQHPPKSAAYTFSRFQDDWSPNSPDNEYGAIQSHKIAAARIRGNVLLTATFINGRKSKQLNLDYDPKTHTLGFSDPDVELYLGP